MNKHGGTTWDSNSCGRSSNDSLQWDNCVINRIRIAYKSASKCDQCYAQMQRKGKQHTPAGHKPEGKSVTIQGSQPPVEKTIMQESVCYLFYLEECWPSKMNEVPFGKAGRNATMNSKTLLSPANSTSNDYYT